MGYVGILLANYFSEHSINYGEINFKIFQAKDMYSSRVYKMEFHKKSLFTHQNLNQAKFSNICLPLSTVPI